MVPKKLTLLLACFLLAGGLSHAGANWEDARAQMAAYESAKAAQATAESAEAMQALQRDGLSALESARRHFEEGGIARSQDIDAVRDYGRVLLALGHGDLAAETLGRAVALAPEDPALLLEKSRALRDMGPAGQERAFEAARNAADLAAEVDPARAAAHALLGKLYWDIGLYGFASEYLARALPGLEDAVEPSIYHAALLAREGDVVAASATLDDLGRAAIPFDAATRVLLRKALWDFDSLRRTLPDNAETHTAYAKLLYRAARLPDAVLALRRALRLDEGAVDNWNLLGAITGQLGNLDQSIEAYERSLAINPDQPRVRQNIEGLRGALQGAAPGG